MSPDSCRVCSTTIVAGTRLFLLCVTLSGSYQTFCALSQALFLTLKPRLQAVVAIYPYAISAFRDPHLDAGGQHAGQHKQRGIQLLEGTLM